MEWIDYGVEGLESMVAFGGDDKSSRRVELQCVFSDVERDDGVWEDGDTVVMCAAVCAHCYFGIYSVLVRIHIYLSLHFVLRRFDVTRTRHFSFR